MASQYLTLASTRCKKKRLLFLTASMKEDHLIAAWQASWSLCGTSLLRRICDSRMEIQPSVTYNHWQGVSVFVFPLHSYSILFLFCFWAVAAHNILQQFFGGVGCRVGGNIFPCWTTNQLAQAYRQQACTSKQADLYKINKLLCMS